jgi:hypothetical protein
MYLTQAKARMQRPSAVSALACHEVGINGSDPTTKKLPI